MSTKHIVKFYPVGNGDTSQIILDNGRRILMDYHHQKSKEDETSPEIDLKKKLKHELDTADRDNFDVVAFTHADKDHISGSTDFFELQHAKKYQGGDRVKIDELWVPAAMLLEEADNDHQSDEFVILRQEARHRLLEGKDILVFSKPKALKEWLEPILEERGESIDSRDHLFVDAGTVVNSFTLSKDGVEFFCHSPFIKHCDDGDIVRNSASLIFNIRFDADGEKYDYLAIGDTEWEDLEEIVTITKRHKNEDRLAWNLFNVPHHCSYLALSDEKGEKETIPKPLIQELLLKGAKDSYEVSSSRPIDDSKEGQEQTQPPHIQAKKAYEKYLEEVKGRRFLVTMEEPNVDKPKPLEFEISKGGVIWKRNTKAGAAAIVTTTPPRAGKCKASIMN
ncbi:hypothetical protein [Kangiella sp. HZ709]|uniref:hypothetical protein n=1 Tax=Kangiella sp. HZ709 TaxID=2666328 RepID=UPI0012B04506|nr:hypothetical protein [Kangiella sp. HZ709]MRX27291.1 hypothetical protein [Kangiella sp. HZ709]